MHRGECVRGMLLPAGGWQCRGRPHRATCLIEVKIALLSTCMRDCMCADPCSALHALKRPSLQLGLPQRAAEGSPRARVPLGTAQAHKQTISPAVHLDPEAAPERVVPVARCPRTEQSHAPEA